MQNFIVLGFIPGTDIQITFTMWLISALSILFVSLLVGVWHSRIVHTWFLLAYLVLIMRRQSSHLA